MKERNEGGALGQLVQIVDLPVFCAVPDGWRVVLGQIIVGFQFKFEGSENVLLVLNRHI